MNVFYIVWYIEQYRAIFVTSQMVECRDGWLPCWGVKRYPSVYWFNNLSAYKEGPLSEYEIHNIFFYI